MKAVEFETIMNQGGQIAMPEELLGDIPAGQPVKVVVMWDAESMDAAWRAAGRLRFEEAYSEDDAIYEQLIHDAPVR